MRAHICKLNIKSFVNTQVIMFKIAVYWTNRKFDKQPSFLIFPSWWTTSPISTLKRSFSITMYASSIDRFAFTCHVYRVVSVVGVCPPRIALPRFHCVFSAFIVMTR